MSAKHTPGPWKLEVTTPENHPQRLAAWGKVDRPGRGTIEAELADARLIAAAPDLLAACKAAIDAHERSLAALSPHTKAHREEAIAYGGASAARYAEPVWRDAMRAAIAKAEGRS